MKKHYSVLEVLFPQGRAELLRLLFTRPHKQYYVRELMRASGLTLSTVQHALRNLSALQLVTSWSNRYQRFYRVNRDHALYADLVHIVEVSADSASINRSAFHRRRGIRRRRGKKRWHLPADYPVHWNLFSKRTKT